MKFDGVALTAQNSVNSDKKTYVFEGKRTFGAGETVADANLPSHTITIIFDPAQVDGFTQIDVNSQLTGTATNTERENLRNALYFMNNIQINIISEQID